MDKVISLFREIHCYMESYPLGTRIRVAIRDALGLRSGHNLRVSIWQIDRAYDFDSDEEPDVHEIGQKLIGPVWEPEANDFLEAKVAALESAGFRVVIESGPDD